MENRRLSPWARAFRPSACPTRPQATVSQLQRPRSEIPPRSFSLTVFASPPCLNISLRVAKAVRGRARFHHVVAGGRKSIWPRIRGGSVSLCPNVRPDINIFLDLSSPSLLASPRLVSCSQRPVKPQPRSTPQCGSTRPKPSDRSASHSKATRSP